MVGQDRTPQYKENSLSLVGAVALGTGVMIGAGIFALTGQMAEMTGRLFPLAFLAAAVIVSFSAYSYVKMSNTFPSAGGIGMYLQKAYGPTLPTAFHALLMYFSMVIAQSFLARTFGSYTLELFDLGDRSLFVPLLGVGLLLIAFLINLSANRLIETVASVLGFIKIGGIIVFGIVGVFIADSIEMGAGNDAPTPTITGFLGATALGILAFKGFTTITNSGSELKDPKRNLGKAITISIALCVVIYALVGFAVASNLSLPEIIETQDYSLAAAARPALGEAAVAFTVILAMLATAGGIIASVFAVSRMLAMLTEMKLDGRTDPADLGRRTGALLQNYAGRAAAMSFSEEAVRALPSDVMRGQLIGPSHKIGTSEFETILQRALSDGIDYIAINIADVDGIRKRVPEDLPIVCWTVRTLDEVRLAVHENVAIIFEHLAPGLVSAYALP